MYYQFLQRIVFLTILTVNVQLYANPITHASKNDFLGNDVDVRLSYLEEKTQQLLGTVEELNHSLKLLQARLDSMEKASGKVDDQTTAPHTLPSIPPTAVQKMPELTLPSTPPVLPKE